MNYSNLIPTIGDLVSPEKSFLNFEAIFVILVAILLIFMIVLIGIMMSRSRRIKNIMNARMQYEALSDLGDSKANEVEKSDEKAEKIKFLREQQEKLLELQMKIEERRKLEANAGEVSRLYGSPRPRRMNNEEIEK